MFPELHFKHKTVCQLITELLQSPLRDNGDTNIITFFPKISVIVKLRNLFITKTCFLSFFIPQPEFPAKRNLAKYGP